MQNLEINKMFKTFVFTLEFTFTHTHTYAQENLNVLLLTPQKNLHLLLQLGYIYFSLFHKPVDKSKNN